MKQKIHASSLFFTLILFALTLYTGCRLNNDDDIEANKSCVGCQTNNGEHLFIRSSTSSNGTDRDGDENEIGNRKIQLGRKRANPFSVTAMTQAWNTLWPNQPVSAIPASHLYVRFKPTSLEEYKLLEPSDIPLTTFPLDYEIIQHGDWYDDPAIPNDQIPWFYSVVPANFQFPAVPYDILESLVLAPMKSELTRRSFLLQSQSSDAVTYRDGCTPECESWPECTEAEHEEGCDVIINGGGGGSHNPPPSPNNPPNDALGDPYNPNLAIPGEVNLNACGCPITSEPRNPGGCIKVVDTQLPANATVAGKEVHLAGVAQVQVTWWNGWFGFSTTHTNNNGC